MTLTKKKSWKTYMLLDLFKIICFPYQKKMYGHKEQKAMRVFIHMENSRILFFPPFDLNSEPHLPGLF